MSLVSTEWLSANLQKVKIIDSSWHMPGSKRDGLEEYKNEHVESAIFFDIDRFSDQSTDLPHMLPSKENWESIISSLGIRNEDTIVIYDNSEVVSACRLWYSFLYFGHDKTLIKVLDGGMQKWKRENYPINNQYVKIKKSKYKAIENKELVKNLDEIKENLQKKKFDIIDARNKDRFEGKVAEPRKGLKSGSIPNSICLPFKTVLNKNRTFKKTTDIMNVFKEVIKDTNKNNIVFSCGSGITSCVLALAYSLINNNYNPKIYDGSWSEYGKI